MRQPMRVLVAGFLLLPLHSPLNGQTNTCPNGLEHYTAKEIEAAIESNEAWCKSGRTTKENKRADFSCADLRGVDLSKRTLCGADFGDADLRGANLADADLTGADLSDADLGCLRSEKAPKNSRCRGGIQTNLEDAVLSRIDATGANFESANLAGAVLKTFTAPEYSGLRKVDFLLRATDLSDVKMRDADLSGADLTDVDLSGNSDLREADLSDATLKDADVSGVDFEDTIFQPKALPSVSDIARSKNLEQVTYDDSPNALAQLRKAFEDGGFRDQAREITFALNEKETQAAGSLEKWFRTVAFKWTCAYGMRPGRTLELWIGLSIVLWVGYAVLIYVPGESGIYIVRQQENNIAVEEQIERKALPKPAKPWHYVYRESRIFFWAGFFCLMSGFNIGFKDIDFGRWLRLLPRSEYDLKAKGWARSVAGVQALLSIYLLALWALTYFGHPFDY